VIVAGRVVKVLSRGEVRDAEALHHLLQVFQSTDAVAAQELPA